MARPGDASGGIAPAGYLTAVARPSQPRGRTDVGTRELDGSREVKPVRGHLRPGLELGNSDPGLDWPSGVRAVDGHNPVDDELGLECRLET